LLVSSNDPDESPYPAGVNVSVTTLPDLAPEYSSTPTAGSTLAFGDQVVGVESSAMTVNVQNTGNANLTLSCAISGTHASSFNQGACPTPISGGGSADVTVTCQPTAGGARVATLAVTTNDADEGEVTYNLSCNSLVPPPAPLNVAASDGTYIDKVLVTWDDAPSAASYGVYRCATASTGTCSEVASSVASSYDDTGADAAGTVHYYRVKACGVSEACSDFSDADGGYRQPSASTFIIGGNASGLSGTGLVLQNNAGDDLEVGANGTFAFATELNDGSTYAVTVLTQPANPDQTCEVIGGSGTLTGGNVTNIAVNCNTHCIVNSVSAVTETSTAIHEACESLEIGSAFKAENGASVFLSAGSEITITPDFLIEQGATLNVDVCGQSLCKISSSPMPEGCHSCVVQICDIDPACCDTAFDQSCLDKVGSECGLACE
jgi:hypothetical protein